MTENLLTQMSENQEAWLYTLAAAVVVLLVVILLLEILRRTVNRVERSIWATWVSGKAVVAHTATTYQLKNTRDAAEDLVAELGHH